MVPPICDTVALFDAYSSNPIKIPDGVEKEFGTGERKCELPDVDVQETDNEGRGKTAAWSL